MSIYSIEVIAQIRVEKKPMTAGIYSAILPGSGQIYSKKYWKIPIIYAGLISSSYYIKENQSYYSLYKKTYLSRLEPNYVSDEFAGTFTDSDLITLTSQYKRNRDIATLLFIMTYVLNIVDASVSAHLFNYDVSEDISLYIEPVYIVSQNAQGLSLSIKL